MPATRNGSPTSASANTSITVPSSLTDGCVVLVVYGYDNSAPTAVSLTHTVSTNVYNMTLATSIAHSTNSYAGGIGIFYDVDAAGESGTYSVSITGGGGDQRQTLYILEGVDQTTSTDGSSTAESSTSAVSSSPTTTADSYVISAATAHLAAATMAGTDNTTADVAYDGAFWGAGVGSFEPTTTSATMGWDWENSDDGVTAATSFAAAAGGSVVPIIMAHHG